MSGVPVAGSESRGRTAQVLSAPRLEALGHVVLGVVVLALYLWFYLHDPHRPHSVAQPGWVGWFDQGFYYKAAIAWAHGNLDPQRH